MTVAISSIGKRVIVDSLLSQFLRGGISALAIKFGAAGLSLVMFLALAKAMSADAYGQFAFGFSLATILAMAGSFGLRNLSLRFAAIYEVDQRTGDMRALIRYSYMRVLIGTGTLSAVLIIVGIQSGLTWLTGAGVLTLALGLGELQPHFLRATTTMTQALFPRDILWRLVVVGTAICAAEGWFSLGASGWLVLSAVTLLAITAVQFSLSLFPKILGSSSDIGEPEIWRGQIGGLWGSSIVIAAGPNVSVVLFGLVAGAEQTGAFFAALRLAMVMNLFLLATNMIAAPLIASRHAKDDRASVQRICRMVVYCVGLPSVAAFVAFVVAGGWMLDLFDPRYGSAKPVLLIISAGYLFSALAGPTAQIMEMQGDAGYQLRVMAISLVATLCVLVPLSFVFGAIGAAMSLAAHTIIWNTVIYWRIWRKHRISAGIVPSRWMETLDD